MALTGWRESESPSPGLFMAKQINGKTNLKLQIAPNFGSGGDALDELDRRLLAKVEF